MVEIYLEVPGVENRLIAALGGRPGHRISRDWGRFARYALRADVAVVVTDWVSVDGRITRLAELRERIRPNPLVVVVRRDADEARALAAVAPSRIPWIDELDAQLHIAIDGARSDGLLERIATDYARRRDLPPIVRAAVVAACRARPPILTVTGLAESVGRDRRTLWRQWTRSTSGTAPVNPKRFLDAILVARAWSARRQSKPWSEIAAELRVHEHTIARAARRILGVGLHNLAGADNRMLMEAVHDQLPATRLDT